MEMGRLPWYQVPRALHLRLLGTICNDILQCNNLRATLDDRANKATDELVCVCVLLCVCYCVCSIVLTKTLHLVPTIKL